MKIELAEIPAPELSTGLPVILSDETLASRKKALLKRMNQAQLDVVIIYADREHGANFEYFTGFVPPFEEALLVVQKNGEASLLLGNENQKMAAHSRLKAQLIHVPEFSLPNQPMTAQRPFEEYLKAAKIEQNHQIGLIGWKLFTGMLGQKQQAFDLPYFIVEAVKKRVDQGKVVNATELLLDPDTGLRSVNNANEIAHYEYGATLAGKGILATLNQVALGKTEIELAKTLAQSGQPNTVTTICATGERFTKGTLYPRQKAVSLGDTFSTTVGYKGGLSSRGAYVVTGACDLPPKVADYVEVLAKPYYGVLVTWLEEIKIGMTGGALYRMIQDVLPQTVYHWSLNPGHLVADEEWLSSPIYPDSRARLKSGQLLQLDIIPKIPGYGGVGCEDGIALCDANLRQQLQSQYPEMWQRVQKRRNYIQNTLQIHLPEEVLPLNDVLGYYRPYLLDQTKAFRVVR